MEDIVEEKVEKKVTKKPAVCSAINFYGLGINEAVDQCLPLLLLACRLSKIQSIGDGEIKAIRETMINDILSLSSKLSTLKKYEELEIARLRYCLCVFIDETVLKNDLFINSYYAQNTLSSRLFNESSGGDKFFGIMDKWFENPPKNKDMLEFIYLCLALGYKGKFGMTQGGEEKLVYLCENIAAALVPTINSNELTAFEVAYKDSGKESFWNKHGIKFIKTFLFLIPFLAILFVYTSNYIMLHFDNIEVASFLKSKIETIYLGK